MSSASPAVSIGIDFGTSNTVIALATDDSHVEAIRFDHGGKRHSVYVSALCFWEDRPGAGAQAEGGPWAIERFLEGRHIYRFLQSFKTFAGSSSFNTTQVFRQRYKFEDILAASCGRWRAMVETGSASRRQILRSAAPCASQAATPTRRWRCSAIGPRSTIWARATRGTFTSLSVQRSPWPAGWSAMPPCWSPISAA